MLIESFCSFPTSYLGLPSLFLCYFNFSLGFLLICVICCRNLWQWKPNPRRRQKSVIRILFLNPFCYNIIRLSHAKQAILLLPCTSFRFRFLKAKLKLPRSYMGWPDCNLIPLQPNQRSSRVPRPRHRHWSWILSTTQQMKVLFQLHPKLHLQCQLLFPHLHLHTKWCCHSIQAPHMQQLLWVSKEMLW